MSLMLDFNRSFGRWGNCQVSLNLSAKVGFDETFPYISLLKLGFFCLSCTLEFWSGLEGLVIAGLLSVAAGSLSVSLMLVVSTDFNFEEGGSKFEEIFDWGGYMILVDGFRMGSVFLLSVEVLHGWSAKNRLIVNGGFEDVENCWGQDLGAYYCPCVSLKDMKK